MIAVGEQLITSKDSAAGLIPIGFAYVENSSEI